MGLIAKLRRALQPRMVDLIRQEQALLEKAIAGTSYQLVDEDNELCRVITEGFTVTFGWMGRERWIDAEIEVQHVSHLLDPYARYSARNWLEAQGLPVLPRRSGNMSSLLLRDELETVRDVVRYILSDKRALRHALFFLAGAMEGYNDVAVVPEDLPPETIIRWARTRFRRLPG